MKEEYKKGEIRISFYVPGFFFRLLGRIRLDTLSERFYNESPSLKFKCVTIGSYFGCTLTLTQVANPETGGFVPH